MGGCGIDLWHGLQDKQDELCRNACLQLPVVVLGHCNSTILRSCSCCCGDAMVVVIVRVGVGASLPNLELTFGISFVG